jgi:hypothetical protein
MTARQAVEHSLELDYLPDVTKQWLFESGSCQDPGQGFLAEIKQMEGRKNRIEPPASYAGIEARNVVYFDYDQPTWLQHPMARTDDLHRVNTVI